MRHIKVRLAEPKDAEKFLEYELATKDNLFDPASGLYPNSITYCTENEQGEALVFCPVQPTFMLESLGIKQDADKKDVALSLRKIMDEIVHAARTLGMGEAYFLCSELLTQKFAEHHGFEKLDVPVYRLRLKDY